MEYMMDFSRVVITIFAGAVLAIMLDCFLNKCLDLQITPWLIGTCAVMMALIGLSHLDKNLHQIVISWIALSSAMAALFLCWLFRGSNPPIQKKRFYERKDGNSIIRKMRRDNDEYDGASSCNRKTCLDCTKDSDRRRLKNESNPHRQNGR